jgi:uncharacterized repeat protein (TIGR04138 family)
MKDQLRALALRDGRYRPEALHFLFESLETAVRLAGKDSSQGSERHVTGQELVAGLAEHARELFGPLAAKVWPAWGVHSPLDWGRIVFLLVDEGLLRRQESDTLADFEGEFDLERTFVLNYKTTLPRALEARAGRPGPAPEGEAPGTAPPEGPV